MTVLRTTPQRSGRLAILGAMVAAGGLLVWVLNLLGPEHTDGVQPGVLSAESPVQRGDLPRSFERSAAGVPEAAEPAARALTPSDGLAAASAELLVTVVDRATGEPVSSTIDLWPQGAGVAATRAAAVSPLTSRKVPEEGLLMTGLPPGLYRAHVRARRRDSEDPETFLVTAPRTEIELLVDVSKRHRAKLVLYDETGQRIRMAVRSSGYSRRAAVTDPFAQRDPGQQPERPTPRGEDGFDFGSRAVTAEEGTRFDLGTVLELDCDRGGSPWYVLTPRDRAAVVVELPGYELRSDDVYIPPDDLLILAGVALPSDWFDDAVRLPDGRRARANGATIRAECQAILLEPDAPEDAWRDAPVHVTVSLAGYEQLAFSWSMNAGPPPQHVMQKVAR